MGSLSSYIGGRFEFRIFWERIDLSNCPSPFSFFILAILQCGACNYIICLLYNHLSSSNQLDEGKFV